MAAVYRGSSKWLFTPEQLENTPSRRNGIEPDRELSYRQQAANLIQDMGQRLNVSQLTINTAIVYMHRFYMLHSFQKFHRNIISPTTLFLAAKVEEQPRKLEHVIKVSHACLNPQDPPLDTKSNAYLQQAQELVLLETILLQTLGFEITIEHPHTDVVRCSQLVRASKDLAQTSYFMATNSLHLTTFCLQHRPQVVACVCIHLACKWSNWEIPISSDGKHWWEYVDTSVTLELLDQLTHEFLQILEKTPSRLKRIRNWRANQAAKKTKNDTSSADSSFQGLCLAKNSSLDSLLDMRSSAFSDLSNSSTSSFQLDLPSSSAPSLSLNGMGLSASAYPFPASSAQSSDNYALKSDSYGLKSDALGGGPLATQQPLLHQPALPPPPPPAPAPQKLSLDKYREKQAAELAMAKRREAERGDSSAAATAQPEPHRKHAHHHHHGNSAHLLGSGSDGSVRVKYAVPGADPSSSSSSSRSSSSKSLKRRLPAAENGSGGGSQEELRMKIKVSERHAASSSSSSSSSGGYGSLEVSGGGIGGGSSGGKSKHASPRQSRDKHREHSSHRQSKHGHSHSSSGALSLAGHADASSASSSSSSTGHHGHHQQSQAHHGGHHHHSSKSSRSSKSSGGSSHHRSSGGGGSTASLQQEVLCQSAGLGGAFPTTGLPHQGAYGSLSTLVKADKKQSEGHGADASLGLNGQHMDYEDTFNMLDSLLSAQQMNF
ncbi:cyclin-T2b isoform X2 [Sardina pilchardus]|uniref:cyclin-T2b isoform X2 n=1 Tax=Sardina pilchardus TaxID=27697 RepID=UPI002E133913